MADRPSASPGPRRHERQWLNQVTRIGNPSRPLQDIYHYLMGARWSSLLAIIVGLYAVTNVTFATLYLAGGDSIENAEPGSFHDAFFFSVQTLATIGYGKMVPRGNYANALVSVEALVGMIGSAMITGLMFSKFSRPTARVLFSRVAVMGTRDGERTFMFRMANERGNQIVEATVRVVLTRNERSVEGETSRRFYDLTLVRSSNSIFALTWTVAHPVTRSSPMHGVTLDAMRDAGVAIIVSMMGIDDISGQTIHARHSYTADEIFWDHRFVDIITTRPDGAMTLDFTRFHDTEPIAASQPPEASIGTPASG